MNKTRHYREDVITTVKFENKCFGPTISLNANYRILFNASNKYVELICARRDNRVVEIHYIGEHECADERNSF